MHHHASSRRQFPRWFTLAPCYVRGTQYKRYVETPYFPELSVEVGRLNSENLQTRVKVKDDPMFRTFRLIGLSTPEAMYIKYE